jgi:hypothetical protein
LAKLLKYYIIKNNLDGLKKAAQDSALHTKYTLVIKNPCKNFYFEKAKTHDAELSKPDS